MALPSVVPALSTQAPSQRAQPGFIKRHPILTYYALTFAISWGALAVLMTGWTGIVPTEQLATSLRPVIFLITIAGPAIAGLVLTGLVNGKDGYRDFVARLRRWRVGVGWWAFAVLTGPLLFTLAVLLVGAAFGTGLPAIISTQDKLSMILLALAVGVVVAACEETGWTGFAIPKLRLRTGVLGTGLMVGILWGAWHMPSQLWGSGDTAGAFRPYLFLGETVFAMAVLPAYRILMVWVYEHAQSLLVAVFMHAVLIMSLVAIMPAGISDVGYLTCCLAVAIGIWLTVAAVGVLTHGHLTRAPSAIAEVFP